MERRTAGLMALLPIHGVSHQEEAATCPRRGRKASARNVACGRLALHDQSRPGTPNGSSFTARQEGRDTRLACAILAPGASSGNASPALLQSDEMERENPWKILRRSLRQGERLAPGRSAKCGREMEVIRHVTVDGRRQD